MNRCILSARLRTAQNFQTRALATHPLNAVERQACVASILCSQAGLAGIATRVSTATTTPVNGTALRDTHTATGAETEKECLNEGVLSGYVGSREPEEMMAKKSRVYQLFVVASSVIALFAVAGCGGDGPSDDTGVAQDSVASDSVEPNDIATDVVALDDGRPMDINSPDYVDDSGADTVGDLGADTSDVSCGTCTGGKICVEGECQCPATQKDCAGTCTTLGTNENCSACGDECPTGGSCESGTCECPGAQVDCSGACTPLGTDDNCSECGDACIGVKFCQDGGCVAEVDPDCVSKTLCVTDDDCESGSRCNQAMDLPACQKLYCGGYGTACSENYFCLSKICADDACVNDCSDLECGPDPVYGESCGVCQEGATCRSNICECELQDHLECVAGNSTWIDSCGNVGEVKEGCALACLDGNCVDCEAVGKVNCSGTCTLLGTNTNCSECGDVCPVGGSCEDGTCECPVGEVDCPGTCTLLGTTNSCSDCGDVCPVGGSCNEGICECPVGEADCSGTCKILGTNENCADCGDSCTGGKDCNDGTCECPVGKADCFGTCKTLGTTGDCSSCGDVCPEGGSCESGACECPEGQTNDSGICVITPYKMYDIQRRTESTACTTDGFVSVFNGVSFAPVIVVTPKFSASASLDGYYVMDHGVGGNMLSHGMAVVVPKALATAFVPGDVISITEGDYYEHYCMSEININAAEKTGTDTVPQPMEIPLSALENGGLDDAAASEELEGLLVTIPATTITAATSTDTKTWFEVGDNIHIDKQFNIADFTPITNTTLSSITGVVRWNYGKYRLTPRSGADIVISQ